MASSVPPESHRFVVPLAVSLLGIVVLGTALVFSAFMLGWPFDLSVQAIEETIRSWGAWGVLASIGLMILHSFVPYPAEVIAIANGMVYRPIWGIVITWTGAMLGAFLAFGLARVLGRPFVEMLVTRNDWHTVDEWAATRGGRLVFIGRLIPVVSFNLNNYAGGLSRISLPTFAWATGLGILPLTTLMVVMGHHIESLTWEIWLLLVAGGPILWFLFRRKFQQLRGREVARVGGSSTSSASGVDR